MTQCMYRKRLLPKRLATLGLLVDVYTALISLRRITPGNAFVMNIRAFYTAPNTIMPVYLSPSTSGNNPSTSYRIIRMVTSCSAIIQTLYIKRYSRTFCAPRWAVDRESRLASAGCKSCQGLFKRGLSPKSALRYAQNGTRNTF